MRRIGIIGGMSPESTVIYYRLINAGAREALGPQATADCLIASMNFGEIQAWQKAGNWEAAGERLAAAARSLETAGADLVIMATNTMHKCAREIEDAVSIPFLHIADATAARLKANGCVHPLLLGTAYTMEQDFYKGRMRSEHGLDVRVPTLEERSDIHRIIFEELVEGTVNDKSRRTYLDIVARHASEGADGVILGCTEIGMLLDSTNSPLPVYDTAHIHCQVALERALAP